jgi:hypothetical protein
MPPHPESVDFLPGERFATPVLSPVEGRHKHGGSSAQTELVFGINMTPFGLRPPTSGGRLVRCANEPWQTQWLRENPIYCAPVQRSTGRV